MTMRLGRLIIYRGLISDAARTMVSARPGGRLEATDGHRKLSYIMGVEACEKNRNAKFPTAAAPPNRITSRTHWTQFSFAG
jgi:hypothetical protein